MNYQFLAPQKIVFGWGERRAVGPLAASLGRRAFVVCGSQTLVKNGKLAEICSSLEGAGVQPIAFEVPSREPEVRDVDNLAQQIHIHQPAEGDLVIGFGGGSTVDLAKAVSGLVTQNPLFPICDYLEGVGVGRTIERPPLPLMAIPTTAGTGSEATKNAVISSYDPPFKKSFRDERLIPRIVVIDPELTTSVPRETTIWSGLDAITQLVESYLSCRAAPIPRALSVSGLKYALGALPRVVENGNDRPAREAMAQAAFLSGMALANSGLGLAHGVAAALGSLCRLPHGLACAVMLSPMLRFNRNFSEADMAQLAIEVGLVGADLSRNEAATALIGQIDSLCHLLQVPSRLRDVGVNRDQIDGLVVASRGNSLSGNPRPVSPEELRTLLEELW